MELIPGLINNRIEDLALGLSTKNSVGKDPVSKKGA